MGASLESDFFWRAMEEERAPPARIPKRYQINVSQTHHEVIERLPERAQDDFFELKELVEADGTGKRACFGNVEEAGLLRWRFKIVGPELVISSSAGRLGNKRTARMLLVSDPARPGYLMLLGFWPAEQYDGYRQRLHELRERYDAFLMTWTGSNPEARPVTRAAYNLAACQAGIDRIQVAYPAWNPYGPGAFRTIEFFADARFSVEEPRNDDGSDDKIA